MKKGKHGNYAEKGGGDFVINLEIFSLSSCKLDEHTTRNLFYALSKYNRHFTQKLNGPFKMIRSLSLIFFTLGFGRNILILNT